MGFKRVHQLKKFELIEQPAAHSRHAPESPGKRMLCVVLQCNKLRMLNIRLISAFRNYSVFSLLFLYAAQQEKEKILKLKKYMCKIHIQSCTYIAG